MQVHCEDYMSPLPGVQSSPSQQIMCTAALPGEHAMLDTVTSIRTCIVSGRPNKLENQRWRDQLELRCDPMRLGEVALLIAELRELTWDESQGKGL